VSVTLPGIESAGSELSTADLQPLEASLGVRVNGILGYEVFSRFVVTVDCGAKTMTLGQPGTFHASNTAQAIPIELCDKWAFVKAELVLPGPVTVQDSFLIDSGSSDAVDHPIVMKLESRVSTMSRCGASDATSRLIGNRVLRRFTVTFDYPSSHITPNC
jgi:hypothetical protein